MFRIVLQMLKPCNIMLQIPFGTWPTITLFSVTTMALLAIVASWLITEDVPILRPADDDTHDTWKSQLKKVYCNTSLTVRHVLLSCAKYKHIRRKYFSFISLFELFRYIPASFIIQFLRECDHYYEFFLLDLDIIVFTQSLQFHGDIVP